MTEVRVAIPTACPRGSETTAGLLPSHARRHTRVVRGTSRATRPVLDRFSEARRGAEPTDGTITSPRDEVTWSGGPSLAPHTDGCPSAADPTCDHFIVRVDSPRVTRMLMTVAPEEGFQHDDRDLFVYDDRGKPGSNADGDGFQSVIFKNSDAPFYEYACSRLSSMPARHTTASPCSHASRRWTERSGLRRVRAGGRQS